MTPCWEARRSAVADWTFCPLCCVCWFAPVPPCVRFARLQQAIRAKLEAQAEFVLWWDTQVEKSKGGRPSKTSDRSVVGFRLGKDGIPAEHVVRRWRSKLNDPDKFETAYEAACARYAKILEFEGAGPAQSHNSGENEWYTPAEFVEGCGVLRRVRAHRSDFVANWQRS